MQIINLYVTDQTYEKTRKWVPEKNIVLVTPHIMKKISQSSTPSNILGVFSIPKQPQSNQLQAGMVFANINDPGNMGTLIRSCAAMKIKSVVIIDGADPWGPKVIQATAGYIACVTVFQWTWQELLTYKRSLKLSALIVAGGKNPTTINPQSTLLTIGNAAHGIPQEWLKDCYTFITLPMPGKTESLNAAIAGSIVVYLAHSGIRISNDRKI
jgi:TrmH family RNA methyltransferase